MITPDNLAPLVTAIAAILTAFVSCAWPLFFLITIVIFRKEARQLLNGLEKATFPGGTEVSFRYGEASVDKGSVEPAKQKKIVETVDSQTTESSEIQRSKTKTGDIFWLGHDLMWTIDVILRGAPRDRIVHGLRQSLHHVRMLKLINGPVESRLSELKANAEKSLEVDWTAERRNNFVAQLSEIIGEVANSAVVHQPGFKGSPDE